MNSATANDVKSVLIFSLVDEDGFGRVAPESPLVSLDIVDVSRTEEEEEDE